MLIFQASSVFFFGPEKTKQNGKKRDSCCSFRGLALTKIISKYFKIYLYEFRRLKFAEISQVFRCAGQKRNTSVHSTMMNVLVPATLLPAAKASGRCPPSLLRDDQVIDGGAFETAMLRALDETSRGEQHCSFHHTTGIRTNRIRMSSASLLGSRSGWFSSPAPINPVPLSYSVALESPTRGARSQSEIFIIRVTGLTCDGQQSKNILHFLIMSLLFRHLTGLILSADPSAFEEFTSAMKVSAASPSSSLVFLRFCRGREVARGMHQPEGKSPRLID